MIFVLKIYKILKAIVKDSKHTFVFTETETRIMPFNSRFYHFIGIIITSDEREETLKQVIALLNSILSDDSFYNSSSRPSVIMTDNCDELHQSLSCLMQPFFFVLSIYSKKCGDGSTKVVMS